MARITMSCPLSSSEIAALRSADLNDSFVDELLAASDKAQVGFAREADWFGVDEDAAGVLFVSKGRTFQLTGFNPKAPKFPISADEVATGKEYRFTRDAAKVINAAAAKRRVTV